MNPALALIRVLRNADGAGPAPGRMTSWRCLRGWNHADGEAGQASLSDGELIRL